MKRGTLVSLTTIALTLVALACRDLTAPHDLAPGSPARLLNPSGQVVVSPGNMRGWSFYNDQNDTACTDATVCRLVDGPSGQPLGSGSAYLATSLASDGKALVLKDYAGTRFDAITELRYSTFRQTVDSGRNLAIALQVNADYDLTDQSTGYQGRLVYEPYQSAPGTVGDTTWQLWDARAGKWWGTKSSVPRGGVLVANPCVQSSPCTWAQLLAVFPNVGIHATYGAIVLKAGSSWPGFRGNVDALVIGIAGASTTFDFELQEPRPTTPPDSVPHALFAALGTVSGRPLLPGNYIKDIVIVDFQPGTGEAAQTAAFDAVGGTVVGGRRHFEAPNEGVYYVRVPGGTASSLLHAVMVLQALPQVGLASSWPLTPVDYSAYRRPIDGEGVWRNWKIDSPPDGSRENWALEYVQGPMAWGCAVGSSSVGVAVVDGGAQVNGNISPNLDVASSAIITGDTVALDHGTRVASVLAAKGNDSVGMTGMAWTAKLTLRDRFASFLHPGQRIIYSEEPQLANLTDHIVEAGMVDGVSVINLSLAIQYGQTRLVYNAEDSTVKANIQEQKDAVTMAILRLREAGRRPLIVIAAGNNDGIPAHASGYAAAKEDFEDQVLVVGALGTDGNVWEHSSGGPTVDVYAPGVRVTQADRNNALVRDDDGTSFAAPLASGVAALLKDFDASLTSSDMIRVIREGARTQQGIRKLDAYGALKKAAERPGAPLCGNRLWNDGNNNIYVERNTGGAPERIISRDPSDYAAFVNPYHGGKRVDLGFSYQYNWDAGTRQFTEVPYTKDTSAIPGGAWRSWTYVSDHDNTFWAKRTDTADVTGQMSRVVLMDSKSQTPVVINNLGTFHVPGTSPSPPGLTCIMLYPLDTLGYPAGVLPRGQFSGQYECEGNGPIGSWDSSPETQPATGTVNETPLLAIPAPQGDAVFVPVNIRHNARVWSPVTDICNEDDTTAQTISIGGGDIVVRHCSHLLVDVDTAVRAMVYRIDVATHNWTSVILDTLGGTTLEAREINSLEISEDGKEMMISTTRRARHSTFELVDACHDESLEWISIDRSAAPKYPPGHVNRRVVLPQGASCGGWVEAGGTVSPLRSVPGGLGKLAPVTRPRTGPIFKSLRHQKMARLKARPHH